MSGSVGHVRLNCAAKLRDFVSCIGDHPYKRKQLQMNQHARYLTNSIFLATCLAFAFTSAGSLGCGDEAGGPTVDSQLLGIYLISQYQFSEVGCESPVDADPPSTYVALYSFAPADDPEDPLLLGRFCGSVEGCRNAIRDFPELLNPGYSFLQGNDAAGWRGWAVASRGQANDQCRADVQAHVLLSTGGREIRIETNSFDTVYAPSSMDGDMVVCTDEAAIFSLNDDPPCVQLFDVRATFEAGI